ncbi:uncharacterized protein RHO25_011295 [Cercospora beticola]|uniref:F-box domain-containing protein n=1 Tax=Cercospora beticola TaxID=122368 RepID=A0ABZ0P436_CERBT|nr:hypothetical protein RHO25_011295 [Cercospora beticola]
MSSTAERTVPYVVAMHLANCAMQLRTDHQKAKDAWQQEREELLHERARLLSENVDLKVEQVRFHNSSEELKMVNGDLQAIIEDLQAEIRFLHLERPLCKEPLHTSAAHRVFAIPELLEHILLQVTHTLTLQDQTAYTNFLIPERPVTQLFQLQRVNHAFAAMIATSPALQRRMGLLELTERDDILVATQAVPLFDVTGFIYAESLGFLVDRAIEKPLRKLDILLHHRKLWPGNIEVVGSWTQIKVALQADRLPSRLTEELTFMEFGSAFFHRPLRIAAFRRAYDYETGRETTWGELVQWMLLARKDFRERRMCWQALKSISPDVFA